jgi:excisionase family DNA binding protein
MVGSDFLSVDEAAYALGVSTRHVRRLADSGEVAKVARGLVDRVSVDRYLASHGGGRTRVWAEHTAWGALAMLAGREAPWLGATQASRLSYSLRHITEADDLLSRLRDRAVVRVFAAHRSALARVRKVVVHSSLSALGVVDAVDDRVDGYLPATELDVVVRDLGLRPDLRGVVTLRITGFDFDRVRGLVGTSVVAAVDAATSTDPRLRGIGRHSLTASLEAFR